MVLPDYDTLSDAEATFARWLDRFPGESDTPYRR